MATQARDELLCPKCQAPLPEDAARATCVCRFCGVVSMPSAPKVIERIVERVVVVSESGAPAAMACPRCVQPLFEGRADDIVLHGCGACGGIWLGNEASKRIAEGASSPEVKALSDRASGHAHARPDQRPSGMPCPMCRSPLMRVRAPRGSIELDVCAAHGTWFDRHELAGVMHALRSPQPARGGRLPTEEELLRAAATPPTAADRAMFETTASVGSANALEQTASRTAMGVTLGLLGAVLAVAAGESRS